LNISIQVTGLDHKPCILPGVGVDQSVGAKEVAAQQRIVQVIRQGRTDIGLQGSDAVADADVGRRQRIAQLQLAPQR
jgi:hypothetical protein